MRLNNDLLPGVMNPFLFLLPILDSSTQIPSPSMCKKKVRWSDNWNNGPGGLLLPLVPVGGPEVGDIDEKRRPPLTGFSMAPAVGSMCPR